MAFLLKNSKIKVLTNYFKFLCSFIFLEAPHQRIVGKGRSMQYRKIDDRILSENRSELSTSQSVGYSVTDIDEAVSRMLRQENELISLRHKVCPAVLSTQRSWCLMLAAYLGYVSGKSFPITALSSFSHSPNTTALRSIEQLRDAGLLFRKDNPMDRRSSYLEITAQGVDSMRNYATRAMSMETGAVKKAICSIC